MTEQDSTQTPQCDICEMFEAEYTEYVEKGDTGEMYELALCPECHDKSRDYANTDNVDWSPEIRLSNRGDGGD